MGCKVAFTGPMVIAGASGPITWEGSYALTFAEMMASFVMTHAMGMEMGQITKSPMALDMETGLPLYADPKVQAAILCQINFSRYLYGVERTGWFPFGFTDARYPGIQAAVEKLTYLFLTLLA